MTATPVIALDRYFGTPAFPCLDSRRECYLASERDPLRSSAVTGTGECDMQSVKRLRRSAGLGKFLAISAAATAAALSVLPIPTYGGILTWDANPANPAAPNDGSGNW